MLVLDSQHYQLKTDKSGIFSQAKNEAGAKTPVSNSKTDLKFAEMNKSIESNNGGRSKKSIIHT